VFSDLRRDDAQLVQAPSLGDALALGLQRRSAGRSWPIVSAPIVNARVVPQQSSPIVFRAQKNCSGRRGPRLWI